MSQRMQYNEESGDYQAGYMLSPDQESSPRPRQSYAQHFDEFPMQKLSSRPGNLSITPGARLALAIVSVVTLVPLISMLLGDPDLTFPVLVFRIAGLGLSCLTLMVVNIAFNWNSSRKG